MTPINTPILPSPNDAERSRRLSAQLESDLSAPLTIQELPEPVRVLMRQILAELGQGHAVSVAALPAELTTQQAAAVLGVSRPFVIKLMDEGQLAYRKVGSHRRVTVTEVTAYLEGTRVARLAGLSQLISETQTLGIGY